MNTYNNELESYKEVISKQQKQVSNLKSVIREKQNQYHGLLKNLRATEKERDTHHSDYLDAKNTLEKLKNNKNKESN